MKVMNFVGEIEVSDNDKRWRYETKFKVNEDEGKISFEFEGSDVGQKFNGYGKATVKASSNDQFEGVATFQYSGEDPYESPIQLQLRQDDSLLEVQGTWKEDGVNYQMEGDLELAP
jgi:hypothetical protein